MQDFGWSQDEVTLYGRGDLSGSEPKNHKVAEKCQRPEAKKRRSAALLLPVSSGVRTGTCMLNQWRWKTSLLLKLHMACHHASCMTYLRRGKKRALHSSSESGYIRQIRAKCLAYLQVRLLWKCWHAKRLPIPQVEHLYLKRQSYFRQRTNNDELYRHMRALPSR